MANERVPVRSVAGRGPCSPILAYDPVSATAAKGKVGQQAVGGDRIFS